MLQTNKKKTKNKPINTSLININTSPAKQIWKNHKSALIATVVIVVITGWYFSDFWPWPSRERVQKRIDEVLEACTGNENSSKCKSLQSRYNMTFKYCSDMTDLWLLDKKYSDSAERIKHIDEVKRYGVVWQGKSDKPPETSHEINGQTITQPSIYYKCSDHI